MSAFSVIDKVPGVYIDEVQVAGVIAGVGTSTAAIIGPAQMGPINTPTLVTNPTQFTDHFGGHLVAPVYYASHAVHGFFRNGGTSCYFVRAGTAVRAFHNVLDSSTDANTTLVVTALEEGVAGNAITIEIKDAKIAETTAARGSANLVDEAANDQAEVDDASPFRAGDEVLVADGGTSEPATIASISSNTLTFAAPLGTTYPTGSTVRVADLKAYRKTFRVSDSTGIEPGSYIKISQGANSEDRMVEAVDTTDHFITLSQGLEADYPMNEAVGDPEVAVRTLEFDLLVSTPGHSETFAKLSVDPRHSRYALPVVAKQGSQLIAVTLPDPPNPTVPPANRPGVPQTPTVNPGVDDDPSLLGFADYQAAIDSLERVDAVNILCIPDCTGQAVQGAMIAHCEKMQDRFAILDPPRGLEPSNGIRNHRGNLTSDRGYAALYYPWIAISDPNNGQMLVPPSGHIAGIFARTDQQKGVHKAPANEAFTGVLDLERTLTDTEAGQLNELSVNVLRRIPNKGFRVWGARTLATSTQWRYVNVRRLLLYVEESIQEGTQEAVFQPNNPALWQTVKRQVTDFLTRVWATGALFGNTPEEAFRVRVDEELNPSHQVALGKLTIEVMLRPTPPAEFIIFRIIADPSRAIVEE